MFSYKFIYLNKLFNIYIYSLFWLIYFPFFLNYIPYIPQYHIDIVCWTKHDDYGLKPINSETFLIIIAIFFRYGSIYVFIYLFIYVIFYIILFYILLYSLHILFSSGNTSSFITRMAPLYPNIQK